MDQFMDHYDDIAGIRDEDLTEGRCESCGNDCDSCICHLLTGPAPKEKGTETRQDRLKREAVEVKREAADLVAAFRDAHATKEKKMATIVEANVMFHEGVWWERRDEDPRPAILRDVYNRTFDAALAGGLMACGEGESWPNVESPINYCHEIALESVRTHAARMAALEGE